MFDIFQNRLVIDGYLVAESGLRVGTGRIAAITGTELAVIRDHHDYPFIPGSSLKGALRSHLESLVRGRVPQNADLNRFACDLTNSECLDADRMQRLKNKYRDNDAGLAEAVAEKSCLICQTFGSPWLASPVRIRDLPVVAAEWLGQFDVRDGVAIDRDKGTTSEGRLYNYEVVPAGTRFELCITAENLKAWQRGLLYLGLRGLKRGDVALGGFTSRGFGWISLRDFQVRYLDSATAVLDMISGAGTGKEIDDEEAKLWVNAFYAKLNGKGARDA